MAKKRVFSRELWYEDRAYSKELKDSFDFPVICDGHTAEECNKLKYITNEYNLKHCFKEIKE